MQCDLQNIERGLSTVPGRILMRSIGNDEARQEMALSILTQGDRAEAFKRAPHRYLAFRTLNRRTRKWSKKGRPRDVVSVDPANFENEAQATKLHADFGYDRNPFDLITDPFERDLVERVFYARRRRGKKNLAKGDSALTGRETVLDVARDLNMSPQTLYRHVAEIIGRLDPAVIGG